VEEIMEQQSQWTEPVTETSQPNGPSQPAGVEAPVDARSATGFVSGKADLGKRAIAALIDGVLAMIIGMVPVVGGIAAAAYWLVRDGLEVDFMDGRSIGKKLMKLRPVRLDGQPMDIETSVRRNWMFAFGGLVSLLLFIPILGWLLAIPVGLVALALGLLEIFRVVTDDQGRRLGDSMAQTRVVEAAE
jgi:uncharacterized RDD family membrane protein YckC